MSVVEPATGKEIGRVGLATPADVTEASGVAVRAQRSWAALPYDDRAAVLRRAADLFAEHTQEILGWLMPESGSFIGKGLFETTSAEKLCREASSLASLPYGEVLRSSQPRFSFSRRLPVGVVGVIAPFNAPIILSMRAVAPALALGNAVILKPDPRTAVCGGVVLARIFEEAGLPSGLFSVLPGGVDVGEALVADPATRVIAFTGSTRGGRAVAMLAAKHLKRAHLELGGNSALIVLDDVDPDRAASIGAFGSFFHQGQICMATSRHLVADGIADEYIERLSAHADALTVGNPVTDQVVLGPMIDEHQRDLAHAVVTASIEAGARLTAGGTYDGLYYRPTVLADVPRTAPAYSDEIFGPVAPIVRFSSIDEAVEMAGDSEYGLSLAILTHDIPKALQIAERVPSGAVHINDQTINDEMINPFGGVRDSGTGRIGGVEASFDSFTEVQWVTMRSDLAEYPF